MDFQETLRSFAFLGGQHAPRAGDGIGIKVLYRCDRCQRIWFQDGKRIALDLKNAELEQRARELSADLAQLPASTCRLCLYRLGGGATEIDEYGKGRGFGFSWEYPAPHLIHAMVSVNSLTWLQQTHPTAQLPDVVTRPDLMRAVLAWFVELLPPQTFRLLDPRVLKMLRESNLPGFGQPGTASWQWKGATGTLPCPPLGGKVQAICVVALPATESFSVPRFFPLWQSLAFLTLLGGVAGETRPDPSGEEPDSPHL